MTDSNVIPMVDLDLDTVERPEKDQIRPFVFNLAGRQITMTDPAELDWLDLAELENPVELIRHCCSREDRDHIVAQAMPGWKLGKLVEAFMQHYRLEEKMAEARRRGRTGL